MKHLIRIVKLIHLDIIHPLFIEHFNKKREKHKIDKKITSLITLSNLSTNYQNNMNLVIVI